MKISSSGLDLIKHFEGFEPEAYLCPAGLLTIGYGSTGKHVTRGQTITQAGATALLARDVVRFENAVNKLGVTLTQNQFDALVAFVYNVGESSFNASTLVKRLKAGDMTGAAAQFGVWNKARVKGVLTVLKGLTTRRAAEAALFRKA